MLSNTEVSIACCCCCSLLLDNGHDHSSECLIVDAVKAMRGDDGSITDFEEDEVDDGDWSLFRHDCPRKNL